MKEFSAGEACGMEPLESRVAHSASEHFRPGEKASFNPALLALVLLVPLLSLSGSPAAAAAGNSVPKLGRLNVVTASTSKAMLVEIPKRTSTPINDAPDAATISGRGRAYGFVLVGVEERTRDAFFSVVSFTFCGRRCTAERDGSTAVFYGATNQDETRALLPRGLYALYLIADGSAVQAEIPLSGLSGSARLSPHRDIAGPRAPRLHTYEENTKTVYSGGRSFSFAPGGVGFSFAALRVKETVHGTGIGAFCEYRDASVLDPLRFAPGCPEGTNLFVGVGGAGAFPHSYTLHNATAFDGGSEVGHGVWYTIATAVEDIDAMLLQVDLSPFLNSVTGDASARTSLQPQNVQARTAARTYS